MLVLMHIAIVVAVIVGAVVLFRRTRSLAARVGVVVGAPVVALAGLLATAVALADGPVDHVMTQLRRTQPVATILENDPEMENPLRDAVLRGLTTPTPDGRYGKDSLDASLRAVLQPYIVDRMRHARDEAVIASAKNLRDKLVEARSRGGTRACGTVINAKATLDSVSAPWVLDMIRTGREARPQVASPADMLSHMAALTVARGRTSFEVLGAFHGMGPFACDLPIEAIDRALAMPSREAAAMLRALGLPRPA